MSQTSQDQVSEIMHSLKVATTAATQSTAAAIKYLEDAGIIEKEKNKKTNKSKK